MRSSIFQRLHRTNFELEKQIKKNKELEEKMSQEIGRYQQNMVEKDEEIEGQIRIIQELQNYVSSTFFTENNPK